jgi:hypothetical protein
MTPPYSLKPNTSHHNHLCCRYVLPGCDALGYIACTGTNFCLRARSLAQVGWFPEYTITGVCVCVCVCVLGCVSCVGVWGGVLCSASCVVCWVTSLPRHTHTEPCKSRPSLLCVCVSWPARHPPNTITTHTPY